MQNWKKGYVFGHFDKFWKGHDTQIKKNTCKNAYLGSIFIPEKYMFRACFESPFTRMISSLKYKWHPGTSMKDSVTSHKWCNRWGEGQGAECLTGRLLTGKIFADLPGKKRQGKKRKGMKIEKKRSKSGKLKMEGGKVTTWEDFFFSLFKTTKICFGSTKMEIFY